VPGAQYIVLTAGAISRQFDVVNVSATMGPVLTPGYPDGMVSLFAAPQDDGGGLMGGTLQLPPALLVSPGPQVGPTPAARTDGGLSLLASFAAVGNTGFAGRSPGASSEAGFVPGGSAATTAAHEGSGVVASAGEGSPLLALDDDGPGLQAVLEVELPPEDRTSPSDLASSLLTGSRPRVQVLPQQGSSVASVATLLTEEGDDIGGTAGPAAEEDPAELKGLFIGPVPMPARETAPKDDATPLRPMLVVGGALLTLPDRRRRRARGAAGPTVP
jgi:hypothetical protein